MKNKDNEIIWNCRFHPTDWWHEVGCPHQEWSKDDLLSALISKKKFEQDKINILNKNYGKLQKK